MKVCNLCVFFRFPSYPSGSFPKPKAQWVLHGKVVGEPQVDPPADLMISGLADNFQPPFGKGVFWGLLKFVAGLDDWNLPFTNWKSIFEVDPCGTKPFQHQSLCFGTFLSSSFPGRKHMVSHSGTPRFLFGGWSMLRTQGINPSSILRNSIGIL